MVITRRTTRGWIKPREGAKYASVSLKVFRRWLTKGELPHVELDSGHYRVHYDDIDHFMEKQRASRKEGDLADELVEGIT
jgi:excisionase family DNA binding protein